MLNALAGHYNSFGTSAPIPKKRLERLTKVCTTTGEGPGGRGGAGVGGSARTAMAAVLRTGMATQGLAVAVVMHARVSRWAGQPPVAPAATCEGADLTPCPLLAPLALHCRSWPMPSCCCRAAANVLD